MILVFATIFLAALLQPAAMSKEELLVLEGNSHFSNDFYQILSKKSGNLIFSPISAHAALSMVYQGAQGTTAQKLSSALNLPPIEATSLGYKNILTRLNNVTDVTLLLANKVFLQDGVALLDPFQTSLSDNFLSEVELVNFAERFTAAIAINAWVENKTKDKVKNLIDWQDLGPNTRLVLVNAIYFKGDWLHKFDTEDTTDGEFYTDATDLTKVARVKMMHTTGKFNYFDSEELDAQILELPYVNDNLSMIVILPNVLGGIKDLEAKLAKVSLKEITENLWETAVHVALPRFKIEATIDLKQSLTELGLGEIFDQQKANFRGIVDLKNDESLYVSNAIQKACIEVNEEGAEAAAATDVVVNIRRSHLISDSENFVADHPFIFYINNKNDQENFPLFVGRVSAPQ